MRHRFILTRLFPEHIESLQAIIDNMNATVEEHKAKTVELNGSRMKKAIEEAEDYIPKTRQIGDDIKGAVKQWNGKVINWMKRINSIYRASSSDRRRCSRTEQRQ